MVSLFEVTEAIGIVSFALSGFFVGVKKKLDLLGLVIVSFLTALGGGVTRDIIVGRIPYSLQNYLPISLVLISLIFAIALKLYYKTDLDRKRFFVVADSIGLVSFSITGALIAMEYDINLFGVIMLSFLTAVGGGMIRDVLLNRVPLILRKELYGSVAIIIAVVLFIMNHFNIVNFISLLILLVGGVSFRLYVYHKNIHLPGF